MSMPECPHCGAEMDVHVYRDYFNNTWIAFCRCNECVVKWKTGEFIGETKKEAVGKARAAACRRPMQKPLTLEELKAICETGSHCIYIEHYHANPDIENPITPNVGIKSGRGYRITHCNGYRYKFMWTDYGKTWRAWISKPTDEERAAAAWEA